MEKNLGPQKLRTDVQPCSQIYIYKSGQCYYTKEIQHCLTLIMYHVVNVFKGYLVHCDMELHRHALEKIHKFDDSKWV